MFQYLPTQKPDLIAMKVSGKLSKEDYEQFVPFLKEKIEQYGKLDFYCEMQNFEGWSDIGGLWEELKFSANEYDKFRRIAVVGDQEWAELAVKASDYLVSAEIKFFEENQKQEAMDWVQK